MHCLATDPSGVMESGALLDAVRSLVADLAGRAGDLFAPESGQIRFLFGSRSGSSSQNNLGRGWDGGDYARRKPKPHAVAGVGTPVRAPLSSLVACEFLHQCVAARHCVARGANLALAFARGMEVFAADSWTTRTETEAFEHWPLAVYKVTAGPAGIEMLFGLRHTCWGPFLSLRALRCWGAWKESHERDNRKSRCAYSSLRF